MGKSKPIRLEVMKRSEKEVLDAMLKEREINQEFYDRKINSLNDRYKE